MVQIAVDVRMAHHSGIGTYIRNVLPRVASLEPDWRFTLIGDAPRLATEAWSRFPSGSHVACNAPIYSVREQLELPRRIPRSADLFWSPHYNVPVLDRTRLAVTVHDLAHLRLPEHTASPARQLFARTLFGAVRRRARVIMCDSAFTQAEFQSLVGNPRGTCEVVHCGVDDSWFAEASLPRPIAAPYFVFVGNLKPHKNVGLILQAMLTSVDPAAQLVVVGRTDGMRTIDRSIAEPLQRLGDRVVVAGESSDEALRQYVQHAAALVLPSTYEGFGLPPLEAMAAGTPALVSRAASLPEVCGDAALYFDAADASSVAQAMNSVLRDDGIRRDLVAKGRARARQFTWTATAARTRTLLRGALA